MRSKARSRVSRTCSAIDRRRHGSRKRLAVKRLYGEARVVDVGDADGGLRIELDGRPVKTPGRALLRLPNRALAEAVAAEWAAQGGTVEPQSMPCMSLACTAIDLIAPRRAEAVAEIAAYAETDLVCYRAERPPELVARQTDIWQPLLDWAALTFDAPLVATTGVLHRDQPATAVAAFGRAVEAQDDLTLAALATAVKAAGSLVIGLALQVGRLDAEAAFAAAELDALFQAETWGEDAEAAEQRARVRADLEAAERFLALLRA